MIEKAKIKLKKGIVCLLASLQVGLVAGCSFKKEISEEKYNEALATIGQLEEEKNALQEELGKKNETNEEDNVLILLANSDIQDVIKKLNSYFQKNYQTNYDFKYDNFYGTHQIKFYSDNLLKGCINVYIDGEGLDVRFYYDNYSESFTVGLYGKLYPDLANETSYIENSKSWDLENVRYVISETTYNDNNTRKGIKRDIEGGTSISISLKDAFGGYYIVIEETIWYRDQTWTIGYWNYDISKKEYQSLSDLVDNYKNGNELGDAVNYIKDALLNIIEKLATNEEYTELKNALESEKALVRNK